MNSTSGQRDTSVSTTAVALSVASETSSQPAGTTAPRGNRAIPCRVTVPINEPITTASSAGNA
jgi:hypothetical protein